MHDVSMAEFRTYDFLQMTQSYEIPGADGGAKFHFKPAQPSVPCLNDQITSRPACDRKWESRKSLADHASALRTSVTTKVSKICPSKIDWDSR
jgi:hypothetical protein